MSKKLSPRRNSCGLAVGSAPGAVGGMAGRHTTRPAPCVREIGQFAPVVTVSGRGTPSVMAAASGARLFAPVASAASLRSVEISHAWAASAPSSPDPAGGGGGAPWCSRRHRLAVAFLVVSLVVAGAVAGAVVAAAAAAAAAAPPLPPPGAGRCVPLAGRYCPPMSNSINGVPCPAGFYCINGVPQPCNVAGYWCPAGAVSPNSSACAEGAYGVAGGAYATASCGGPCTGAPGTFCAAGSTEPTGVACLIGSFCAGGGALPLPCTCARGSYCAAGAASGASCAACSFGTYCALGGAAAPVACSTAGSWCPARSTSAGGTPCGAGHYGTAAGAASALNGTCSGACTGGGGTYCPPGAVTAGGVACSVGSSCTGGTAAPLPCSAGGYWCPSGSSSQSSTACAAGCWGSAAGAAGYTSAVCAGTCTCAAGYYCPAASTTPAGIQCPRGYYCAGAGGAGGGGPPPPSPCAVGGFWCPAGSASPSAPTNRCAAGYYGTAAGAVAYTNNTCGGGCVAPRGAFCPRGTPYAGGVPCPAGYVCAGGPGGGLPVLPPINLTGYFCATCLSNAAPAALIAAVHRAYTRLVIAFAGWGTDGSVLNEWDAAYKGFTLTRRAVAALQANGTSVLLSIGGAGGNPVPGPPPPGFVATLAGGLARLVPLYGLDGFDIDAELFSSGGDAEAAGLTLRALVTALRAAAPLGGRGARLVVTAAPQLTDLYPPARAIAGAGAPYNRFVPLAAAGGGVDVFMPQVRVAHCVMCPSAPRAPWPACACHVDAMRRQMYNTLVAAEALTYVTTYVASLAAGFVVSGASGSLYSVTLPPSALALGYPAVPSAAGSGYHAPALVVAAFRAAEAATSGSSGGGLGGLMTWSIDADAAGGWPFASAVAASMSNGTWVSPP
jgi:chitinase